MVNAFQRKKTVQPLGASQHGESAGSRDDALSKYTFGEALSKHTLDDPLVQRRPAKTVQGETKGGASQDPVHIDNGGGQALSKQERTQLGSVFDMDLSGVRIHTGSPAAQKLNAEALTHNGHVHVAGGSYSNDTLGHELGHLRQQNEGRVRANAMIAGVPLNDSSALESEADDAGRSAARALAGPSVHSAPTDGAESAGPGLVQRRETAQPVIQRKLKMVHGYTETMNWSSEAQELIEVYESFESLFAQVRDITSPHNRRMKGLSRFKTAIEASTIPNNAAVRKAKTVEIERQIETAKALYKDKTGRDAGEEDVDDIEDADASDFGVPDTGLLGETNHSGGGEDGSSSPMEGLRPSAAVSDEDAAKEAAEEGAPVKVRIKLAEEDLFTKRSGRLGEAEGTRSLGGEMNASSASGEASASVSLLMGKKGEKGTSIAATYARGRVKGEGTIGAKADASIGAEGSYDLSKGEADFGLKGKLAAFAGASFSTTPTVEFTDSAGTKLMGASATMGVNVGVGYEYEGECSLNDWRVVFKSKGKTALGLGMEWGVAFDVDLAALKTKLVG